MIDGMLFGRCSGMVFLLRSLRSFAAISDLLFSFAAIPFLTSLESSMDQKTMTTELDTAVGGGRGLSRRRWRGNERRS